MAIRSGRFNLENPSGETIISGRSDVFYRFLNSGVAPFSINTAAASYSLEPTFSLDLVIGDEVTISGSGMIEGIYEFAENRGDLKSGRFNIKNSAPWPHDPSQPHPIIIDPQSKAAGYYRLYNSGEYEIIINGYKKADGSGVPDEVARVAAENSVDFQVGDVKHRNRISVRSNNSDEPVSGIYEFLGRV